CVREQDITLFKGLIFRKVITQPICRIQHIEVKRGPIDRKVNLAKLHVYSAGDIAQTFEIPGLDFTLANSIRNELLAHKDMQHHG
ncbi:MAG: PH domain-containing protein, partial [Glaciecola sp.]|nr:PH domain-containing protein [Glaciecola sp.]